ncbi:MAG TPA: hypothetical protein VG321_00015 [Solirubrobacteraceae bacterium]|nr:hypothetical protein [Solirubrobacteraceae bacterium]
MEGMNVFAIGGGTVVRRLGFGAIRSISGRRVRVRCARHPADPGTASPAHLEENVAAASLCIDDEEVLTIASAAG